MERLGLTMTTSELRLNCYLKIKKSEIDKENLLLNRQLRRNRTTELVAVPAERYEAGRHIR
jgi:hypothetical protein